MMRYVSRRVVFRIVWLGLTAIAGYVMAGGSWPPAPLF